MISSESNNQDEFVIQTEVKLQEAMTKLMESSQEHLNRLKSRRIALEVKMAASARQTFPDIEPYVEPTNSISDKPYSSNRSSFLKLNVGGKRVDISRSTLTQIQGSKLALIFSGKWDEILPHDKDGRIFMDFDPSWLDPIINQLRDLAIADPSVRIPGLTPGNQPFGVMPLLNYLDLESVIEYGSLSSDQWATIKSWIPNLNPALSTPQLVFRGSRDGFTAAAFHANCDGVPDTVTIVRDTNGSVFGGYADVAWSSSIAYVASSKSFLFSLSVRGAVNPKVCRLAGNNNASALKHNSGYMATFGGGGHRYDLYIADGCNANATSATKLGNSYTSPNNSPQHLTGGDKNFQVSEIEVWRIIA